MQAEWGLMNGRGDIKIGKQESGKQETHMKPISVNCHYVRTVTHSERTSRNPREEVLTTAEQGSTPLSPREVNWSAAV